LEIFFIKCLSSCFVSFSEGPLSEFRDECIC